ncbi:late endosometo vacuole transport-related protein [Rhodotorula toruloides]|uniref:Late endosometo vacuole transport-related protein n=1 Tax=Rhodotorula toruloides TaxID=5286 RepID=A0A511KDJ8_RHOTO|nr:late endosometo vacuole transport-related protein [Rhodotorula toruloides]
MTAAPPSVPTALKPVSSYLARAHELAKAEPVIAYWCTYYALQQGMSLRTTDNESQAFMLALMDKLEEMKAQNTTNDAFTDDIAAAAYIENFGLKLFSQADNEDRKAAANFLELLSIFGEISSENRDKIKYGKWKAADIAKAFREGRTPTPGPAGGVQEGEEDAVETSRVSADEAKELSKELAAMDTSEKKEEADSLVTSPASVKARETPRDESASYPFPQQPMTLPSAPPDTPDFTDDEPLPTVPPTAPSFLDDEASAFASEPNANVDEMPRSPTHQTSELPHPHAHAAADPPAFPSAIFPAAPPLPPQPSLPTSVPPPSSANAPPRIPDPPAPVIEARRDDFDPMTIANVQKHARWAISALNYEDVETARKELRLALAILGG